MAMIEENLLGLILLLLAAAAVVVWVLLSNRRERVALTNDEEAPRRTLPPLPKMPPPPAETSAPAHPPEPVVAMRFAETIPEPDGEANGAADDLTRMKGIGPKVVATLARLGITRYDQIAAWSDDDAAAVDAKLGTFKGRITRDHWVEQAKLLAGGDVAGYEAKFGKL